MSIILYGVPLSPYVRKVRVCLAHKQLDYKLEIVSPFNQPDWFLELNPLGRIPALKDDELSLADSSVICQYLDEKYPNSASLLGDTIEQRAAVRWLEKYADYELAPSATFTVFQQRIIAPTMQKPTDEALVQSALNEKLPPLFDYLEDYLGDNEFFVGESLTLADIAVSCQLMNMEHGGEQLDESRWPNLAALHSRVKQGTAMHTMLEGEQKILASLK
ncbi:MULTISPECIES: glutathione S-transferase family protein [Pseudoalteromonas]|jgi:glutathione S-transferase|uniref:glutathione S-transferase family protein n=1 Tax=Pseudoalteromonas TaxID=53246 RepID=UPI00051A410B|nr:glutathione S-transferase family protein [Pseudoalteromonas sp. ND6B]KGK02853.1 Glutathione S-transferase domain-containing protein [Pseudoalteromonas sp. ND6B]